ncbi:MAG: hypothetical protein Ct9H300mP16_08080 [Pseudomonadota bacterium]|nr:MAG: hypothetical protein Ct9H300mP16_08080 [Pseudomonadota bacterium]
MLVSGGLHAIEVPFNWIDIGELSDYWEANQQLMRGQLKGPVCPERNNSRRSGRVLMSALTGTRFGLKDRSNRLWQLHRARLRDHRADLDRSRLHLEGGARISRSILFEYSRIGSRGRVTESLVFGRNCVDQDGNPTPDPEATWTGLGRPGFRRDPGKGF